METLWYIIGKNRLLLCSETAKDLIRDGGVRFHRDASDNRTIRVGSETDIGMAINLHSTTSVRETVKFLDEKGATRFSRDVIVRPTRRGGR